MISETFPTEDKYACYVPYPYDSVSKTKISAKGKLNDRHGHRRSDLIQSGATESHIGVKRKFQDYSAALHLAFRKDLDSTGKLISNVNICLLFLERSCQENIHENYSP